MRNGAMWTASTARFRTSFSGMITVFTRGFAGAAVSGARWRQAAASTQRRTAAAFCIAPNSNPGAGRREVSRNEERVVRRRALRLRPPRRVVVQRYRFPRHPLGCRKRMRMSVKRRIGRRKNHRAVENRQDLLAAGGLIALPKLQMSAVLVAPILVEIHEHVQAAIELQFRMNVEVGVNLQKSARLDLMQAAAAEVRIGDQSLDAGERLQPQQHLERVHVVQKVANGFRDGAGLVMEAEFLFRR